MVPYLLLFFLPLLFLILRKHRARSAAPNLPPGRLGWPVIGESLAFNSAIQQGRPEKFFFDRGAADGAAFKTSLLGERMVVLCGAAGNEFVFSNENKLVTSWIPHSFSKLFYSSDKETAAAGTRKLRRLLPGLLKMEALRRSIGVMDEVARRHFAADWGGGDGGDSVSVVRLAKRYSFRVVTRLLASLDSPEDIKRWEEPFLTVSAGIFSIPVNIPGTAMNRAMKAKEVLINEILKVIKRRKSELAEGTAHGEQDLLSHLLVTNTDNGPDSGELYMAYCVMALIQSSHGNTSDACASVVKYLKKIPRVHEAVHQEQMEIAKSKTDGELLNWEDLQKMKYSWDVAQEVLRIETPAPGMFREAIADFTFGGFSIPKGWKIFWSTTATHKNPAYFPDPERFDPARFEGSAFAPYTYVPFGGGPRMCPGKDYAKAKILVFMHNFVKQCPLEKILNMK